MLPLGHLALAYLGYVGASRLLRRPLPATWALLPLAIGSQFPDVVDKPLAHYEVLTYGRSLAHSLFTTLLVCGLLWWGVRAVAGRWPPDDWREHLRSATPLAFAVGYAAHLLGDAWGAIAAGNLYEARFLLWTLYRLPETPADDIPPWIRLL